jgi:hypothetical protein
MAGVFAAAASDIKVRGNRLENCFFRPGESAGTARGLDIRRPIDVRHSENVVVESNVIIEAGEASVEH